MNEPIKPEPPRIIAQILWFKMYWKTYWKLILAAIIVLLLISYYQDVYSYLGALFKEDTVEEILGRP